MLLPLCMHPFAPIRSEKQLARGNTPVSSCRVCLVKQPNFDQDAVLTDTTVENLQANSKTS
ncbi:MAG: hypothetical protein UT39_C0018G0027 [Candidatus Woesebacteria bacterium GW2011_GWA1_39_21]|uniref:Uncharacterized protein n=1 Tax=Candidatus Woesebacteria bacterium GW2011_GWA1_39_21 TaxID=1618550 RepID=A0A0G0N2S7_9BACT|nr:MAG: hypothetical protein UT39_C0018G0027 [Candidatus Woesebacteria bacterium GW2011_GWA1_39_21]